MIKSYAHDWLLLVRCLSRLASVCTGGTARAAEGWTDDEVRVPRGSRALRTRARRRPHR